MENILISALEPQKKRRDRINIYSGGEYIASLGAEACARFKIRAGKEISEETLRSAIAMDNEKYAFDFAAGVLARGMRTRSEMEKKLSTRQVDEEAAKNALDKLEGYGYIDDAEYAAEFVRSAIASCKSRRVTEYKLKGKGVASDIIEAALEEYTGEMETDIARKCAETIRRSKKDKKQIFDALARRGFDYDIINSVLSGDE